MLVCGLRRDCGGHCGLRDHSDGAGAVAVAAQVPLPLTGDPLGEVVATQTLFHDSMTSLLLKAKTSHLIKGQ